MSRAEYDEFRAAVDSLRQAVMNLAAQQRSSETRTIPEEVLGAINRGETPIRAWRKYRGMTQADLARAVGVTAAAVHYIETGASHGRPETCWAVAEVLDAPRWAIDPARFAGSAPALSG